MAIMCILWLSFLLIFSIYQLYYSFHLRGSTRIVKKDNGFYYIQLYDRYKWETHPDIYMWYNDTQSMAFPSLEEAQKAHDRYYATIIEPKIIEIWVKTKKINNHGI